MAIADISSWLSLRTAQLHVLPPGQDGSRYVVPSVGLANPPSWLDDAYPVLGYSWPQGSDEPPSASPSGAILDEFIRLSIVDDGEFPAAVLEFARRYGVLEICKHLKPRHHPLGACPPISPGRGWEGWENVEPLSAWRRYARHLRALLLVAGELQCDGRGSDEDWESVLAGDPPSDRFPRPPMSPPNDANAYVQWESELDDWEKSRNDFRDGRLWEPRKSGERMAVCAATDVWLRYGRVKLESIWRDDSPFALSRHRVWGLPAALAVGLQAGLEDRIFVCAGCKMPARSNPDKRRPSEGRKFWCDSCGRAAQKRAAAKQHYQRKKAERRQQAD